MAFTGDDDMIMHRYVKCFCSLNDFPRHVNIRLRGLGVAAGVVVDQNQGCGADFQCAFHDFPGIGGCVVHGSGLLDFVGQQFVLLV